MGIEGVKLQQPVRLPESREKPSGGQGLLPGPKPEERTKLDSERGNKDGVPGPLSEAEMLKAIEQANEALVGPRTMFKFSIHQATHAIMVKVINEETGEVIREIPPEKILDMVAKMWEMAGLFVDQRV